MAMSLKEKAVVGGLVVGALYVFAGMMWFLSFQESWASAKKRYENEQKKDREEKQTISEKAMWEQAYQDEVLQIREIEEDQNPDTLWFGVIQDIAARNHITITSQKTSREEVTDEMKEMKVDLDWIGALETLVKFLYELETTDEGMFDVQAINFTPSKQSGFLVGKMTLTCIYRR